MIKDVDKDMPAINMLIKPASGNCNLRCLYCFYCDEMKKRNQANMGIMSLDTLEILVKKALSFAEGRCLFAFQGGEPTLAGIGYFKKLIEFENKYNVNHVKISHSIQTNGTTLNEEWVNYFSQNDFLVGVSVDGIVHTHDRYRKDEKGLPTFSKVMAGIKLLEDTGVQFNILTVVNSGTARRIRKIYEFYGKQDYKYLQFIPCLDPLHEEKGKREYSLTPQMYGEFLCDLFDLWYEDYRKGTQPYIREFENYLGILLGFEPEACAMKGICGAQLVVEADGSVYPCDFYALDKYKMGNITTDDCKEVFNSPVVKQFIEESASGKEECKNCRYEFMCRGGCRRHRQIGAESMATNYFCEAYKMFFEKKLEYLKIMAKEIRK